MAVQSSSKNKIPSTILSIAIVLLLIFSGPVRAITLGIDIEDDKVEAGEVIEFTAKVDLHSQDILPELLLFNIDITGGEETHGCTFDINGKPIGGTYDLEGKRISEPAECEGFKVIPVSHNYTYYRENTSLYGYGYGFSLNQNESGTFGVDFGYGYGYGYSYGYGYNQYTTQMKEGAEIVFKIRWTAPEVKEETEYSIIFDTLAMGEEDWVFYFPYRPLEQGKFTVYPKPHGSFFRGIKKQMPTYDQKVKEITDGLVLQTKNKVEDACNQMRGVIERSEEGKVYTNTSQFQEQIRRLGLDNVEAVMTNSFGEHVEPKALSDEIKAQISNKIGDKEWSQISKVKRNVKVTTFIKEDGTSMSLIEISYEVESGDYVVEIPKSVAGSADEIEGNFEVLINDPVIRFEDSNVAFEIESKTNKVEGKVNASKGIRLSKLEEEEQQPEPAPIQEEEEDKEEDEEPLPPAPKPPVSKETPWIFWVIGFAVAAIFIVSFVMIKKHKSE